MPKKILASERTVAWSIRTDKNLVKDYKEACRNLPIILKPAQLIHSYMKSIVEASEIYKKTGAVKLEYIIGDKNVIIYSSEGRQGAFEFRGTE